MRRILYATDFSNRSRNALDASHALARDYGAELIALFVQEPQEFVEGEFGMSPPVPTPSDEELLARLQALLPDDESAHVLPMVAHGMPAEEIVRVAKEMHCDLIVLGMHANQGWLANLFHANVAEEVKHSAPCCVMAVNGAPTATPATL